MPRSRLKKVKREFKDQLERSFKLIRSASEQRPPLPRNNVFLIYELSFLKMFLAWEYFIENTFIIYMLGKEKNIRYRPKAYVMPKDEKHAYDFVRGDRDFADWSSPDIVIRKAKLFFEDGMPYRDALSPSRGDIQNMKTIRNAIVHMSLESREKFKTLVRSKLGYAKSKITPGEFLSLPLENRNLVYISYFRNQLEIVCDKIAK